jgi:hypothetical protein
MIVHTNVTIKNEKLILNEVIPYWKDYDIDQWVFYDDNSTDKSSELIKDNLGDKAIILNDRLEYFNETHNRNRMLNFSREKGADYAICIDADELLSANFANNIKSTLTHYSDYNMECFWYNVVGDINKVRNDPCYSENFKSFIAPLKYTNDFNHEILMHCPRTPHINLPKQKIKEIGFIHLQAINKRFYALKQLWYKHFEYHVYNYPIDFINSRYDPVVNNLDFQEINAPESIIQGIEINPKIYDEIEKIKGYQQYVRNNYIKELVTFGDEYI